MTATFDRPMTAAPPSTFSHPLDPLSLQEITAAVSLLRAAKSLGSQTRFATVVLHEPPKNIMLAYQPGDVVDRQAFLIVLDNATAQTYEAVVSLTAHALISWEPIPGVQPPIMLDEFIECEEAVKANPDFQAALLKRGITDPSLVMVDPWSAGNYGLEDEKGVRLSRALCWVRSSPSDNGYARPLEGVIAVVNLNTMEVVRIEDYGVVPLPPQDGNYTPEFVQNYRKDLKPLEIVQPEGPSFQVNGYEIKWQNGKCEWVLLRVKV